MWQAQTGAEGAAGRAVAVAVAVPPLAVTEAMEGSEGPDLTA